MIILVNRKVVNYGMLSLVMVILQVSCNKDTTNTGNTIDFRQKMREFVIGISSYSKAKNPKFYILPQNGIELLSSNGDKSGLPHKDYLNAIDGNGQEDLFYGYQKNDQTTDSVQTIYLTNFLNISKNIGKKIFVTDYCSTPSKMDNSYLENNNLGYISFAADHRELNNIPNYPSAIYQENKANIASISQVKNFLYLINTENYASKADFVNAVTATNYDLVIMDLFYNNGSAYSASDINQLKNKANGGKRLIICYISIGEAENYRYYWQPSWNTNKPQWLDAENPNWPGNYKVKYWYTEWQSLIYGNENSYLKKIVDAGFDGAYLDIIDAFEYYE